MVLHGDIHNAYHPTLQDRASITVGSVGNPHALHPGLPLEWGLGAE